MSPSRLKKSAPRKTHAASHAQPASAAVHPSDTILACHVETARRMRSQGATDAELCVALRISADTLAVWQGQNEEFAKACVVDDAACVKRLKNMLYEQALGCTISAQTIVEQNGKRKVTIVKKEVPPDKDVAKFLLINLDPKNWRLKPEPPPEEEKEDGLVRLLREISQNRHSRIGPVAMYPEEVDSSMLKLYGGELPERAKGWKHNPKYNPEPVAKEGEEPSKE